MKKDYDSTRIYRNTQKKGASQTYDTPSYTYITFLETNAMHCFSASSVSCVTERLSGCKDTDLYWIRANYYLKKYYSTVAFFDNFNRTTSCITVNELQTMGNVNMVYII